MVVSAATLANALLERASYIPRKRGLPHSGDSRKPARKNLPEPASFSSTAARRREKGTAVSPIRILLVDDDANFRELLALLLRADVGAEIVGHAADGSIGVQLAEELRPDV